MRVANEEEGEKERVKDETRGERRRCPKFKLSASIRNLESLKQKALDTLNANGSWCGTLRTPG